MAKLQCSLCNAIVDSRGLVGAQKLDDLMLDLIRRDNPDWAGKRGICKNCREKYRAKKFLGYLEQEYDKISEMERALVGRIARRGRVAKQVDVEFEAHQSLGERLSDKVAHFGGSWRFITLFGAVLVGWMALNSMALLRRPFDPYPFILLNLVLSTLAAMQAPIIMMSQNRQADKDRLEAQQDYEINLMAEIEIRDLHDKLDALRYKQWHELWQLQQRQIQLLEHLHTELSHPDRRTAEPPPFAPEA